MPVLPIGGKEAAGIDVPIVISAMLSPRDEVLRNQYLCRLSEVGIATLESQIRSGTASLRPATASIFTAESFSGLVLGRLLEPFGGFATLTKAPGLEQLQQQMMGGVWPGAISGDILITLLQLRAAGLEASLNKAIAVEIAYLSAARNGKGKAGSGKSERYIQGVWKAFKPVCHLWATFQAWATDKYPSWFSPFTDEGVRYFLSLSAGMLALSAKLQAKGAKQPLIDVAEVWQIPPSYPLPATGFHVPPLQDWKLEALRKKFKSLRS